MKTILLLHDESGSPKPRLQNVAGSKLTQRPSEGMPGCNCDRWGHPSPDCVDVPISVIACEEQQWRNVSREMLGAQRGQSQ